MTDGYLKMWVKSPFRMLLIPFNRLFQRLFFREDGLISKVAAGLVGFEGEVVAGHHGMCQQGVGSGHVPHIDVLAKRIPAPVMASFSDS